MYPLLPVILTGILDLRKSLKNVSKDGWCSIKTCSPFLRNAQMLFDSLLSHNLTGTSKKQQIIFVTCQHHINWF